MRKEELEELVDRSESAAEPFLRLARYTAQLRLKGVRYGVPKIFVNPRDIFLSF